MTGFPVKKDQGAARRLRLLCNTLESRRGDTVKHRIYGGAARCPNPFIRPGVFFLILWCKLVIIKKRSFAIFVER